jgi:hypothetical protein
MTDRKCRKWGQVPGLFYFLFPFVLFLLGGAIHPCSAATLSGKITDEEGKPLPFATIYLQNTTLGATSNQAGVYFLKLDPGEYTVVVKYIGYKQIVETLQISGEIRKDFQLEPEEIEIEEVVITPDGKDPAYAIIQKAIDRKEQNKIPFAAYSYDAYHKTVLRSSIEADSTVDASLMESIPGFEGPDSSDFTDGEEIIYLEENLSTVWKKAPRKQKEEIISSQVSGASGQYSFVGNLISKVLDFSPYRNLIPMEGLSARGIVSPISNSAMLFYDYKLVGTVKENGTKAYKIKVIPKRPTDPVFTGTIYILDELYAVRGLDLFLTRDNQIMLMDTLKIKQDFVPQADSVWVPFGLNFNFKMDLSLLGVKFGINGTSEAITSNYTPLPDLTNKFFDRELLAISDSAVDRDSAYWEKNRPVPLPEEEARDYIEKDSINKAHSTPEYLDSLTSVRNEFNSVRFLISGYTYRDYRRDVTWELRSPLETFSFNAMEGFRVGTELSRRKRWENGKTLQLNAGVRYGIENKKLSWKAGLETRLNRKHQERLSLSFGDHPFQFSSRSQISPLLNMNYALWVKRNYLKLYQAKFARIKYRRRLFNGVSARIDAAWEERSSLRNTSDFSWSKSTRAYEDNLEIPYHHAALVGVTLNIQPGNKYVTTPDGIMDLGSQWPLLTLKYRKGIPGIFGSDADFDYVEASLQKRWSLGLLGDFEGYVGVGDFLSGDSLTLPDLRHVKANQTIIRSPSVRQFNIMQYYAYSTRGAFLEAHGEQAFKGFLLNKIPGIKRLQLWEYAGVHFLYTREHDPYLEMNIGLEKRILKGTIPLRVDAHLKVLGEFGYNWYVTFTWFMEDGNLSISN